MSDFNRNVWCLLGLPFDAVDIDATVYEIYKAAREKTPLFISTPNVNFLISSTKSSLFRNSVINSDLSLVDGKPILWMAKLLGIPLPERVAGSDLVDALIENKKGNPALKVFFFGGQKGVASQACEIINKKNKGLECVGSYYPGFCSVEEMSTDIIIEKINQCDPDFIIVSLGAAKGQEWIVRNKKRLNAPVISHLGAVVNFITGDVRRSPVLLRKIGLEWLWRIKEEPALWRRYYSDGVTLFTLLATKVLPYKIMLFFTNKNNKKTGVNILKNSSIDVEHITITGVAVHGKPLEKIKESLNKLCRNGKDIHINLDGLKHFDGSFIAFLMLMKKIQNDNNKKLRITSSSQNVKKILKLNNCDYLIDEYQ